MTRDASGNLQFYINGIPTKLYTSTAAPDTSTAHLGIGGKIGGGFSFLGKLDDVRIYNRALSAGEVAYLYNSGAVLANASSASLTNGTTLGGNNGLVGLWTFDGKDTNWRTGQELDESGNGNTGSLVNMSTSTTPTAGHLGQALSFDGSSNYIDTANFADNLPNFTVSAWFKTPPISGNQTLVSKITGGGVATGQGWVLGFQKATSRVEAIIQTAPGNDWVGKYTLAGPYSDNQWHQAMMVVTDGNTLKLYIDGIEQTNVDNGGTIGSYSNTSNVRIGNDYNSELFSGAIDDVRVYNRALSATEVKQLYKLGTVTIHPN